MPLDKQAKSYLWDIHEAAREIKEILRDVKCRELEKNKYFAMPSSGSCW